MRTIILPKKRQPGKLVGLKLKMTIEINILNFRTAALKQKYPCYQEPKTPASGERGTKTVG